MCGIAGIISLNQSFLSEESINDFEKAATLLNHRGPDYFGKYVSDKIAFFHYRLSILDLDKRSNQPFTSANGNIVAIYNGEVYNFHELKDKYSIVNYTTSDTEIVVESFRKFGIEAIKSWNGIFACALYNINERTITLVRDRYGVKPLYTYIDENYFLFSSEAKVIYQWIQKFRLNKQSLIEYLWYGNTISENTIVEGVKKLLPGTICTLKLDDSSIEYNTFWQNPGTNPNPDSFEKAVKTTKNLIENAVKRQLVSDVSIGIFLSGGIDSSAITAFATKHHIGKLNTYSVEFDFNKNGKSELDNAAFIAKTFNTNHHELKVTSTDITNVIEDLVFQHDEPFADAANIPLFLLTKKVKGDIKVVLQGDGGDEFFAGYRRYNLLDNIWYWRIAFKLGRYLLPPSTYKNRVKRLSNALSQSNDSLTMAYLLSPDSIYNYPEKIFNSSFMSNADDLNPFNSYFTKSSKFSNEGLVQKMLYTDTEIILPHTYFEKVDKSTMLNSIEARVPFVDNELTSYVSSLPSGYKVKNGEKKYLLRKVLRNIVPDKILDSPKRGFGVPFDTWLKTSLYEYALEIFSLPSITNILNQNLLIHLLNEHKNGEKDNSIVLWKSLILSIWVERYKNKIIWD